MSDIKKALEALYKQRDEINKKISSLEQAVKIVSKVMREGPANTSSLTDKILKILFDTRQGLSANDVALKIGGDLPSVRSTLSRLKKSRKLTYDKDHGVYKSIMK